MATKKINFKQLSKELNNISKGIDKSTKDMMNTYALSLQKDIIERSPVDKGTYKGSHRITVGYPSKYYNVDNKDAITQATLSLSNRKAKDPIFIQTNLPYSRRLEDGYSKKAPNGIYSKALEEVEPPKFKLKK
ncbi:HK97 gp10 family phage protein [Francisella marina]|uniref:HK97 gp10 family phage protein n=1 Tax=Francisella marina TaxID=2249302 RepID=UPI0011EFDB3A|nr:HK97 gp10 family phage protein [Francisella marina]QEO58327.1 HK97 gp10 family phage protein [Francisella marina]